MGVLRRSVNTRSMRRHGFGGAIVRSSSVSAFHAFYSFIGERINHVILRWRRGVAGRQLVLAASPDVDSGANHFGVLDVGLDNGRNPQRVASDGGGASQGRDRSGAQGAIRPKGRSMIRIAFVVLFGTLAASCYLSTWAAMVRRADALAAERVRRVDDLPDSGGSNPGAIVKKPPLESQSTTLVARYNQ